jgi:hypothetical protein
MSSIMRDASTITKLKQARTLYSYNAARINAVKAGASVKVEAVVPTNDLLNARREGAGVKIDAREVFTSGCACTSTDCSGCPFSVGTEH